MALFRKPTWEPPPDASLPLSTDGAAHLRGMVRDAFAGHGVEVMVLGDVAADRSGKQYPLRELALTCKDQPEAQWLTLVGAFVADQLQP